MPSLLSSFLAALGVPHTTPYADRCFATMPFKSLFGLSRQLKAFGVDSVAARWDDKSILTSIPAPFLAHMADGSFVIVEAAAPAGTVRFRDPAKGESSLPDADFEARWSGVALLAYPDAASREPDLAAHRLAGIAATAKKWTLALCVAILLVGALLASRLFDRLSALCLLLVDFAGLGVTWLLILKSLNVSSRRADRICGILQEHGCDTVLRQKASSFFGIFSWSEVGLSYFAVSTVSLLLFPQAEGWLALVNLCALPFTVWSIWYQRFRIHTWCTLCVTTQCLLWLQAGCYLWDGAWLSAMPLTPGFMVLLAAYGAALLGLNRVTEFIKHRSDTSGQSSPSTRQ